MPFEQRRPHHEQFARGFEAYLREGRAPVPGLKGIFQRFGSWLQSIYRQADELQVRLTDEMRGVYGRPVSLGESSIEDQCPTNPDWTECEAAPQSRAPTMT